MKNNATLDWVLRFVKGFFIGSGFILPGVSGGALAAVFGVYERMIAFIAHITKDFKKNVLFFIPVGLGGVFSVFLLSFAISFFLGAYETQILWFFVGCIVGTMPALWKEAGKKGRSGKHIAIMAATAVLGYLLLYYGETMFTGSLPLNPATWAFAGALMGLGAIVPGLSPSNFLVYFGMYKPMTDGIKELDLGVILPVGVGAVACVLLLSKLMNMIFNRAYTGLFHFIFGIVLASTVMIVPLGAEYDLGAILVCAIAVLGGVLLGWWMSSLEERYK
jgi:putative membrane protein